MPKLSLCMIVRDEAESLGRAIGSFRGVADEIVVVDTGSMDDTVAVAQACGARVVHHMWGDDFSAARNAGFEACTGDWIFALDADEFLLPESREEVRRLIDNGAAQGYMVTRRDVTPGGVSEMRFLRLGRRVAQRLVGRIHEHFDPPWKRVETSGILIEHEGYAGGRNEARLRRNVRLLEMELRDRPGQLYYLADLTHAYWLLSDERWAETLAEVMRRIDPASLQAPVPLIVALIEIVLATAEPLLPLGVTHVRAGELAERWYPNSVPLLVGRARLAFGRGDMAAAADLGERAVARWEEGDYDRTISFDPTIVGPEMRLNVGVALAQAGRLKESLVRLEEAAADPRFTAVARQNIAAVQSALDSGAG